MPALLPMLALSTQLVMVADKVPEFDPGPGCRAAPIGQDCLSDSIRL